ncbi:hypothetical protein GW17_00024645 [Ensete ventricosum]|nr:hypothetical protein GW17_00024645 [Ensete ventricosum]
MLLLRFPNSGVKAKVYVRKIDFKLHVMRLNRVESGGRLRPRSPTRGLPAATWVACKSSRPWPARSQAAASLRLAYGRGCQRRATAHGQAVEATASRGGAYGHGACRQAAYGQKLSPARVIAYRSTRRSCAHGGAARG